jgi:D-alanyl-D-alanine carboxypeptidase (penicillin-binding protein 5/6)
VYDMTADRWLAGNEADTPRSVGSLMKLLTAHVVMQAGDPTHVVTVPALGLDPMESMIGLYQGEQLPRDLLLRAMMIVSANDAAKALAIDLAGSEEAFAVQMNAAAAALGLTGTAAANARGLDAEGAHSTATDMTRLAALLLQDETFRTTVARTDARLHDQVFPATNDLLTTYPGAIGVKTGRTTDAGWCVVGAAARDGRTIVVTVLGSSSDAGRVQAASALLDWAFAQPA